MVPWYILNFLLQHFLLANRRSVVIFNCWPVETKLACSQLMSENFMFTQFVEVNKDAALQEFPTKYLQHLQPQMGIFLDLNCQNSEKFLNQSNDLHLFSAHYRWLIFDAGANLMHFRQLFEDANLAIDADLTYAVTTSKKNYDNDTTHVYITDYDVYNNGRYIGGKLNITANHEWRCSATDCQLERYLSELYKRSQYRNRCSMKDVTMRMATLVTKLPLNTPETKLLTFLRNDNDPAADGIQRFGFQLMSMLAEMLDCNVSYRFIDRWSSDTIFGGAIGYLINETAELISAPFIATSPRLKYISVLIETGSFRSVCLFRTPRNTGFQGGVFLEPFTTAVWLIFGLLLLLAAVLLWSTFFVEYHGMSRFFEYVPSFLSTCLISFGSACFQGSHLIPNSTGGRMAFFSLSLITFIMNNYYTSMVVSTLLGSPVKSDIKSLGQLADSSLDVGLEPLSYTMVYLNTSRLAEVRNFVKRKMEFSNSSQSLWMPVEEGVKRVRDQPGFVYIFEASTGYAFVERYYEPHQICDLNEFMLRSEHSLYTQLPKNSSIKEVVRLQTLRLLETGVYLKLHRYWIRSSLHCFDSNFIIDVGMEYAAPLFFMLLAAYILVFIVLLLEIAYNRYQQRSSADSPLLSPLLFSTCLTLLSALVY